MAAIQDFLGLGTTLVMFALVVASVMKIFQLATDVRELKEVLVDIRRNTAGHGAGQPPAPLTTPSTATGTSMGLAHGSAPTPEELVRAVHAQHFGDDEFPL